jgi:hypothetical protein
MLKNLFRSKARFASAFAADGFFGSKLGQAAIASTFAMTAMVVLTSQVGEASAASIAGAAATVPVSALVEIA